jgi:hypothetical protein
MGGRYTIAGFWGCAAGVEPVVLAAELVAPGLWVVGLLAGFA